MEPRVHRKAALIIVIMTFVQAAGSPVRSAVFAALILWAARNAVCALQAVSLGTVVIFTSSIITSSAGMIPRLKWVLLAVALIRVAVDRFRSVRTVPRVLVPLFVFCLTTLLIGYAVSAAYAVTVLKLAIFVVGVLIAMLGFSSKVREYDWTSWFYTIFVSVLVMSVPLVFFRIGYDKTGRWFQGVLSHPQAFGVFIAPFVSWSLVEFLKNRGRKDLSAIFIVALAVMVFTKARTSMLAFSLGMTTTYLASLKNNRIKKVFSNERVVVLAAGAFLLIVTGFLVARESIVIQMGNLITKGYNARSVNSPDELIASVTYSRERQIDGALANFAYDPFFGVGFGMTDKFGIEERGDAKLLGIPLSTKSEMGFIFLAILGQTGLVGSFFFLIFLGFLFMPILKYGDPGWVALSTTAFFVNFGETILFSSGGLGAFSWLLIGYAHLSSLQNKYENTILAKQYQPPSR